MWGYGAAVGEMHKINCAILLNYNNMAQTEKAVITICMGKSREIVGE